MRLTKVIWLQYEERCYTILSSWECKKWKMSDHGRSNSSQRDPFVFIWYLVQIYLKNAADVINLQAIHKATHNCKLFSTSCIQTESLGSQVFSPLSVTQHEQYFKKSCTWLASSVLEEVCVTLQSPQLEAV